MYRLIYKCPDCGRRPKTSITHLTEGFGTAVSIIGYEYSVYCCHTVSNSRAERVAMANWNDMAAAKLARRAAQAQG
jgi:hypothetical protein